MKRTNLVLDEQLLEEVTRLSGERTYSGAVNRALLDYARRIRAGRILELAGRGYVFELGTVTMHDQAKALLSDPRICEAYLGEG